MGSNFSRHSGGFELNRHFDRVAEEAACETVEIVDLSRGFRIIVYCGQRCISRDKDSPKYVLRYAIGYRGAVALIRKVAFNVVATVEKRLARFQMNSPRELSPACVFAWEFQEFPCGVTTFEKLPFLHHSINLDRSFCIIYCTSQREVLIGLFARRLTNNRKKSLLRHSVKSIQEEARNSSFRCRAFWISRDRLIVVVRAFCKVFLRRFCRPFAQHTW